VIVDQDPAEAIAERSLDGQLERLGGPDHVRDQAADRAAVADPGLDVGRPLHDRPGAAGKALVALLDLDQRLQARPPAVDLGTQHLDPRLAGRDLLAQELLARGPGLGLVAQVEPGLAQGRQVLAGPRGIALDLAQAIADLGLLVGDPGQPALGLLAAADQRFGLGLGLGLVGAGGRGLAAGPVEARLRPRQVLAHRRDQRLGVADRRLPGGDLVGQPGQLGLALGQARGGLGELPDQALALGRRLDGALGQLVGLAGLEPDLRLGQSDAVVELVELLLQAGDPALLDGQFGPLGDDRSVLRVVVDPDRQQLGLGLAQALADPAGVGAQLEVAVRRLPQIEVAQLLLVGPVALGLLGLAAQRAHALAELGDDVRDAQEVLLGLLELLLGRLLLALELGDAGGLLDDQAAVGWGATTRSGRCGPAR
jgi:hypothetical protein